MVVSVCSVKNCDRIILAKKLCAGHYSRKRKGRSLTATIRKPIRERDAICSVSGCDDLARAKDLCGVHALRLRRTGSVQAEIPVRKKTLTICGVTACTLHVIAKGLCPAHYYRLKKWGDVRADVPLKFSIRRNLDNAECAVASCKISAYGNDLCELHFNQQRYLNTRYHITVHQYEAMVKEQDGLCAICKSPDTGSSRGTWSIDHDHECCTRSAYSCGECIRGLVCFNCNGALGGFHDSIDTLLSAVYYLQNYNESKKVAA